jgi:hypothetical protein
LGSASESVLPCKNSCNVSSSSASAMAVVIR